MGIDLSGPPFRKRAQKDGASSVSVVTGGRSKGWASPPMVNETLCKILCHNLVVLIHEMCELGIDPVFWPVTAR
jgi:hypothetical protein